MLSKFFSPRWIFFVGFSALLVAQLVESYLISYPPNQEQLPLIFLLPFANYAFGFWVVKFISLALMGGAVIVLRHLLGEFFGVKLADLTAVFLIISPTFYAAWNLYPIDSLKCFLVISISYLALKSKRIWVTVLGFGASVIVLIGLSNNQPLNNIPILSALDPKRAEVEIKDRLDSEMGVVSPIEIPLVIKRIAYNKPYFIYKNVINLAISYGDLESLFFQEVNNLGNKSMVIFFWPEFVLFAFGLYCLVRRSRPRGTGVIGYLLLLSFFRLCFTK